MRKSEFEKNALEFLRVSCASDLQEFICYPWVPPPCTGTAIVIRYMLEGFWRGEGIFPIASLVLNKCVSAAFPHLICCAC